MANLLTYRDAYEHLLDVYHQNGKDVRTQGRRIRRAIVEAYNQLPSLHNWEYFRRTGNIATGVSVDMTGTFVASTKQITLSTGTWGDDVQFGSVTIGAVRYPVSRRISDTVIELKFGPEDDSTGIFCWEQYRHLLPVDVGDIIDIADPTQWFNIKRVSIGESFWWDEVVHAALTPYAWSLISSPDVPGRWEIWLSGTGNTGRNLRFLYNVRHTGLDVQELKAGTVSVTDDVATFTDAVLTDRCVGAVLRIGEDGLSPTSTFGRVEKDQATGEEEEVLRPAEYERIITEVTSSTEAVLSTYVPAAVTSRGFTISSHIDVNYEGMREFFFRLAEEQYDIITRAEPSIQKRSRLARMSAMRAAMAADGPAADSDPTRRYHGVMFVEEVDS